jgi:type II secretory pathway pseudopilin PulG
VTELLVVVVLLSLIIAAVLDLYVKGQAYLSDQATSADLQQYARNPLTWLARDIKTAVAVESSWGSFQTSATTLILRIPSIDATGRIIDVEADFDRVVYRISGRKLIRIFDALDGVSVRQDSSRTLGDHITAFVATYYDSQGTVLSSGFAGASTVGVSVSAALKASGRTLGESLGSRFRLRNRTVPIA